MDIVAGQVRWVGAQEHAGANIGSTPSHALFIELKEPAPSTGSTSDPNARKASLGPE